MTNTDFKKGHSTTYTLLRNTDISFKNNKAIMRLLLDIARMPIHKLQTGLFRNYSASAASLQVDGLKQARIILCSNCIFHLAVVCHIKNKRKPSTTTNFMSRQYMLHISVITKYPWASSNA